MSEFTESSEAWFPADTRVAEVADIRVLHDRTHGAFVTALSADYPELQAELDKTSHIPPITPGTVIYGAEIDSVGRAHFVRVEYGEPWYLPAGWYEVLNG